MIRLRLVSCVLACASVVGCATGTPSLAPSRPPTTPEVAPSGSTGPAATVPTTPAAAASASPTSADGIETIPTGETALTAGTHRVPLDTLGFGAGRFPTARITLPAGWGSANGAFLHTVDLEDDEQFVALQFWDVRMIYEHPCQWTGTLIDPGPTVDDLANALAERPMRNASKPVDVTVDGYRGKYLEWSVPADVDFETCDTDGGEHFFESWTGSVVRTPGGDRYQQAPGQVDRLWILDVNGARLVIDAFAMAGTSEAEAAQAWDAVASLKFDD